MRMDNKLEYIPGDLVMVKESALQFAKDKIFKVISSLSGGFLKVVMLNDSSTTYSISNNAIRPIPLTPEILEKNGWNKSTSWFYVGSEERGYQFSKELDDKWDELDRMTYGDLQICQCENLRDWSYINECNHYFRFEFTYVHELQHLLYALHIDSNLKI